jgi:hypothetical protein
LISSILFHEKLVELFPGKFSFIPYLLPQPVEIIVGKSMPIQVMPGKERPYQRLNWHTLSNDDLDWLRE